MASPTGGLRALLRSTGSSLAVFPSLCPLYYKKPSPSPPGPCRDLGSPRQLRRRSATSSRSEASLDDPRPLPWLPCQTPCDATLAINALEIADQKRPEI